MNIYLLVKTAHIISSTLLLGGGLCIAFFMFCSKYSHNIDVKYFAAKNTVLADFIFTTPAVIIQPFTGFWLMYLTGYSWSSLWIAASLGLYVFIGLFWIPVVFIQIKLRDMLVRCRNTNSPLPKRYHSLFRLWYLLGFPAFISLIVIFYLMVAKIQ
jgi:uncharacterized membrane protein